MKTIGKIVSLVICILFGLINLSTAQTVQYAIKKDRENPKKYIAVAIPDFADKNLMGANLTFNILLPADAILLSYEKINGNWQVQYRSNEELSNAASCWDFNKSLLMNFIASYTLFPEVKPYAPLELFSFETENELSLEDVKIVSNSFPSKPSAIRECILSETGANINNVFSMRLNQGKPINMYYGNLSPAEEYSNWLTEKNVASENSDPTMDADNDGVPNGIEFILNSDPKDPGNDNSEESFKLQVAKDNSSVNLNWTQRAGGIGQPGIDYALGNAQIYIEVSSDLTSGWTKLTQNNVQHINRVNKSSGLEQVTVKVLEDLLGDKPVVFTRLRADF